MLLHVSVILFTGGVSQHALQVVSQHALQQVSRGWYPSMPCRFPGPHPGGKLRGLARGVSRPTPRGISRPTCRWSPGPHPGGSPGPHPGGLQAHTWWDLQVHTQGGVSQHALRQSPPTATAAGDTHPTGMPSCWKSFYPYFRHACISINFLSRVIFFSDWTQVTIRNYLEFVKCSNTDNYRVLGQFQESRILDIKSDDFLPFYICIAEKGPGYICNKLVLLVARLADSRIHIL